MTWIERAGVREGGEWVARELRARAHTLITKKQRNDYGHTISC